MAIYKCVNIVSSAAYFLFNRKKLHCVYCNKYFVFFIPYRNGLISIPDLHKAIGLIGSDVDNFSCSRCSSTDRERHLNLYFEATKQTSGICGSRILHFAPERKFATWLTSFSPSEHVLADLHPTSPSIRKIDLLSIPFSENYFDFVIANHVLEHVDDDIRALSEIHRVLKPGGIAILQTPYCEGISEKIEDHAVISPEARLQLYGQEDHVRLYGRDFRSYICSQGFDDICVTHREIFSDVDTKRYGVNALEPFLRFRKPI